ncbi:MAG: hypothetical protein E6J75_09750 [Deltaproteobacteria bacterium]|nr:MAG: hypothetical protein E6J75_09750 [Deltaproteobacteria bacterium]
MLRLMRDAERRREIKDYYLGISADEITSYLTPASFDLWESLARYRRELQIGARWLEIGGGMGDLAAAALDRGYDVLMTDVQDELCAAGSSGRTSSTRETSRRSPRRVRSRSSRRSAPCSITRAIARSSRAASAISSRSASRARSWSSTSC